MDWYTSLVKMAATTNPVTAPLAQLQSDLEFSELESRVQKLEDPISHLHPDVPELSKVLYQQLKASDNVHIQSPDEIFNKYSRALAALRTSGAIDVISTLFNPNEGDIIIADPAYIMYMCRLVEDFDTMEALYQKIDACSIGQSLQGEAIQKELGLPIPVINAAFDIFEAKGYGICARTQGSSEYIGRA